MHALKRRKVLLPLVVVAIFAIAGGAVAFWTSTGTGTGTATVGTTSSLTLNPVSISGTLYPGGTAATSAITINNPGASAVRVSNITLDTTLPAAGNGALSGIGGLPVGCSASDFSFTSGIPVGGVNVPAGGNAVVNTGTLQMANTAANQDACKNANLTIYLRAS